MKTLKKIIFISIVLGMISSLIISCKSDDKQQTGLLTLNILEGKIKIGAHVSVELSLSHPDLISKIVVKKSIEGKEVSSYLKELNVKELSFPYTFTEEIIAYNVFSPSQALMTHYNVLQLSDRKMILESYQDLSGLGDGYSSNERVLEVYTPVSKTEDFTPYRGQNPDNYIVASCNPGSY